MLVLLVSLVVAPYEWFTDQAISLPALIEILLASSSRLPLALAAFISTAIEIGVLTSTNNHSNVYLWVSLGWIGIYLLARRTHRDERECP